MDNWKTAHTWNCRGECCTKKYTALRTSFKSCCAFQIYITHLKASPPTHPMRVDMRNP